jgi:AraC-like DNA-binding protein
MVSVQSQQMFCSVRLIQPFLALVTKRLGWLPEIAQMADPATEQLPVIRAHGLVDDWVHAINDQDLGLRAGERTCLGSYGLLDYAFHTAATLGDSLLLAQRYASVISEALKISVELAGGRVAVRFASRPCAPRALDDLLLSSWYRCHMLPHLGSGADITCHFSYSEPVSIQRHRLVFPGARLAFGAAFNGFTFESQALRNPLASADGSLHEIHRERLTLLDSDALQPKTLSLRVQRVLALELGVGRPTSSTVARTLRMSRRTLARRLALEGTTFSALLDERRRSTAQRLLTKNMSLTEIATRLGFVHVQAFHRAFKRWTGSSPNRYREEQALGRVALSAS